MHSNMSVLQCFRTLTTLSKIKNKKSISKDMATNLQDPFEFLPYHEAIREPFTYYMFVQNYIRPLINSTLVHNICVMIRCEKTICTLKKVALT